MEKSQLIPLRKGDLCVVAMTAPECPYPAYSQAWEQWEGGEDGGRCYRLAQVAAATKDGRVKSVRLSPDSLGLEHVAGVARVASYRAAVWDVLALSPRAAAAMRPSWSEQTIMTPPLAYTREDAKRIVSEAIAAEVAA